MTNGKLIRLFVDDEPFDVRYGERRSHERLLDFRAGVLNRGAEWVSSAGKRIRVSSTRLVSFSQRSVAAICYEVEPLTISARFALQSELVTNEKMPGPASADPRAADKPEVRPIQVIPARPRPSQPPGREPVRRPAPEDG